MHRISAGSKTTTTEACSMLPFTTLERHLRLAAGFVLFLLMLATGAAFGQQTTADIVGTVSDSTGAIVPNAQVVVENIDTHVQRKAETTSSGDFVVNLLNPGHYSVTVTAPGFSKFEVANLTLTAGDRARADASLKTGAADETVTVEAVTSALQTDSSVLSSSIVAQAVQDIPLNGRNYVNLAQVLPGSTEGSPNSLVGGGQPDDRRQSSAVSVNGQAEVFNNFLIDGMDNNERLIGTQAVRPSIDAIDEIRIQTNAYTAEVGRTGGGVISIITKSGTDQFHGTAYEFFRNDILNASAYAFGAQIRKPELRQNQFGGSIGGPILRNRTFFFADFENFRSIQGLNPTSYVVPTLFEEQNIGNFSDIGGPVLTAAQLDRAGVDYFKLFPAPNVGTNHFVGTDKLTQINYTFDVRIDHRLNASNLLYGRVSYNHTDTATQGALPSQTVEGVLINPSNQYGLSPSRDVNSLLAYVHTFTPNLLLELKAGFTHVNNQTLPLSANVNANTAFGQPNVNYVGGLAQVVVNSATTLGISGVNVPLRDSDNIFQEVGTITYTRGKQNIKMGASLIRRQVTNYQSASSNGQWTFSTLPNLLLGAFSSVSRNASLTTIRPRIWEPSVFIQDDVHFNQVLTFNLGLRYDVYTPFTDANNGISNFDPVGAKILVAGQNGVSSSAGVTTDYSNVAPRLGFAANLPHGFVLRGAYGITFFPSNLTSTSYERNIPFLGTYGPCTPTSCPAGFTTFSAGLPPITGNSVTNPTGSINAVALNFRSTYLEQYNFTAQQEFGANILTLSYVGSTGRHVVQRLPDINAPGLNTAANPNSLRPYYSRLPGVTAIANFQSTGVSYYNALQAVFQRRLTHGLGYNLNYTWSHDLDNSNSFGAACGNTGYGAIPSLTSSIDYGNSCLDLRNRFAATANYELPYGKSLSASGVFWPKVGRATCLPCGPAASRSR